MSILLLLEKPTINQNFFIDLPLYLKDYEFFNNLRVGILHESNGKGDENLQSRSWNRIYVSTAILYNKFLFVPRLWYRIPENKKMMIILPSCIIWEILM